MKGNRRADVSQIYQDKSGSYYFLVHTENEVKPEFSMNEFGKLQEFRRGLIGFIWPNADVFDPSKNDAAS
jgi:hypothetical protein